MDHPTDLTSAEWKTIQNKYDNMTLKTWNEQGDPRLKIVWMRMSGIQKEFRPIFGNDYNPRYPENIYLIENKARVILDGNNTTPMATWVNERKEYAGEITYTRDNGGIVVTSDITHVGDFHKVIVDVDMDVHLQTSFHTHPRNPNVVEPPSTLDIANYIETTLEYIRNIIFDVTYTNKEPDESEPLLIQNEIVFAHDGVYVFYVSYPLIENMVTNITGMVPKGKTQENADNFIDQTDLYIKKVHLNYVGYLERIRPLYINNDQELFVYIRDIERMGLIMKRFPYNRVESYVVPREQ